MKESSVNANFVIFIIGLGTALSLIGDTALYTVLPTHTADAAITLGAVGVMLSVNRWVRLLSNGAAGWICDQWPRRWLFVPALFIGTLATATYGFGTGYWPLLIGRLLWGIAWSGIWVAGNAIVLDVATEHNRGKLVGWYNVAFFAGAASGSFFGGWMTDLVGYRPMMQIATGLVLAGAVTTLIFLPETKQLRQEARDNDPLAEEDAPVNTGEAVSILTLMGLNRLLIAGMLLPTLGLFMAQVMGDSLDIAGRTIGVTTLTGIGLSVSTFVGMAFVAAAGNLADRWGNRWRVAALGLVPGVAGFILLAFSLPWAIIIGLPLTSMTSGSNQGMTTTLVGDIAGKRSGRFLGVLFTVGDLASAIGPLLVFWLIGFVSLSTIYLVAAILFGAMGLRAGWLSLRSA